MKIEEAVEKFKNYKSIRYQRASEAYPPIIYQLERFCKRGLLTNNDDITAFQAYLKRERQEATQAQAAAALKSFFEFTNGRGWTKINLKEILTPRVTEKIPVYVVQSEFETLCDLCKESPRDLIMLRLLWFTGVRVSELCDFKIEEMDLNERFAKIQARKAFRPKTVFWDEETNRLIKSLNITGTLFPVSPRQVQRIIQKLVDKAGIQKHITPHSFRHGCAHQLLDIGVDLPALQDLLGHKHPSSIFKYTKRLEEDIKEKGREAVRRREKVLKLKELAKELDLESLLKEG